MYHVWKEMATQEGTCVTTVLHRDAWTCALAQIWIEIWMMLLDAEHTINIQGNENSTL